MVSGILAYKFGATFAWITSLSVAAYIAFTLIVTQVQFFDHNLLPFFMVFFQISSVFHSIILLACSTLRKYLMMTFFFLKYSFTNSQQLLLEI